MAYKTKTFSKGETLTHDHMNNIIAGIDELKEVTGTGSTTTTVKQLVEIEGELTSGSLINKTTGAITTYSSGLYYTFTISDASATYYGSGYAPSSTSDWAAIAYYTSDDVFISYEDLGLHSVAYEKQPLTIPSNTGIIRIMNTTSHVSEVTPTVYIEEEVEITIDNSPSGSEKFTMNPLVEMGALDSSGAFAGTYYGKKYYRTPKYIKVADSSVEITVSSTCQVSVFEYGKNFAFLRSIDYADFTANTAKTVAVPSDCSYIRLAFRKSSALEEFGLPAVKITNVDKIEYFNIRPSNGFQRLIVPVNVADPTASDTEEWTVKDTPNILADYGVLMLPETYSNIGKPTRLIIYCHGAGVNYADSVTGFPSSDCDPDYWLAEGCAIMDIEGNPYNNVDEHGYVPAARQSYMAAYNWIINNYNICRDGVFLGGRSMGGGMTFEILQSTIPVIASCPVVPVCNQLWWWNYMSSARRKFCAEKMGFTGTAPTWGASGKILSDDEKQYLYDNFDKMVKYSPLWRGIENLPDKDELFKHSQITSTNRANEAEAEMYSNLRFKVKAPVKIFASKEDTTVPYERNAVYMYNMIKNAAQPCELRVFSTDASSAHHFEQQDSRAYTDVTTIYGETMSAPLVYIEMMQFWRRYEKTI